MIPQPDTWVYTSVIWDGIPVEDQQKILHLSKMIHQLDKDLLEYIASNQSFPRVFTKPSYNNIDSTSYKEMQVKLFNYEIEYSDLAETYGLNEEAKNYARVKYPRAFFKRIRPRVTPPLEIK